MKNRTELGRESVIGDCYDFIFLRLCVCVCVSMCWMFGCSDDSIPFSPSVFCPILSRVSFTVCCVLPARRSVLVLFFIVIACVCVSFHHFAASCSVDFHICCSPPPTLTPSLGHYRFMRPFFVSCSFRPRLCQIHPTSCSASLSLCPSRSLSRYHFIFSLDFLPPVAHFAIYFIKDELFSMNLSLLSRFISSHLRVLYYR